MRVPFSTIAVCLALLTSGVGHAQSKSDLPQIVAGQPAAPGQFPWQVGVVLTATGQLHCGGSILSAGWILTAAHCVAGRSASDVAVAVGSLLPAMGDRYDLADIVVHPQFNGTSLVNDIALLRLNRSLNTPGAQPVLLAGASPASFPPQPSPVTVSGWGLLSQAGPPAPTLQFTRYLVSPDAFCAANAPQFNPVTMGCAANTQTGACNGDSGGALVAYSLAGVPYQGGIVSFASANTCSAGADYYTNVTPYLNWIIFVLGR